MNISTNISWLHVSRAVTSGTFAVEQCNMRHKLEQAWLRKVKALCNPNRSYRKCLHSCDSGALTERKKEDMIMSTTKKKKGGRSADLMVQALAEVYGNRDGLRPSG